MASILNLSTSLGNALALQSVCNAIALVAEMSRLAPLDARLDQVASLTAAREWMKYAEE